MKCARWLFLKPVFQASKAWVALALAPNYIFQWLGYMVTTKSSVSLEHKKIPTCLCLTFFCDMTTFSPSSNKTLVSGRGGEHWIYYHYDVKTIFFILVWLLGKLPSQLTLVRAYSILTLTCTPKISQSLRGPHPQNSNLSPIKEVIWALGYILKLFSSIFWGYMYVYVFFHLK